MIAESPFNTMGTQGSTGRIGTPAAYLSSGVTLLELLVAITVFAIMSAACYSGLRSSLKAEENFYAAMKDLEAVQMSLTLFQRDIVQMSPRPIRDAFGDEEAAALLYEGRELTFTRGGNFSSLKLDQGEQQRVSYYLDKDKQFVRLYWQHLDITQGDTPSISPLLNNVNKLQIRVLDQNGEWYLNWPPEGGAAMRAVELTLDLEGWGEIRRLLSIQR